MALALVTLLARLAAGQAQQSLPQELSQVDIMNVIVGHKAAFARCNRDNPGPSGMAVLRFRIAPDGQPHEVARVGGDLQNSAASSCLEARVWALRFPRYQGPPMPPVDFPFAMGPHRGQQLGSHLPSPATPQPGPSAVQPSVRQDVMNVMVAHKDDVAHCKKDHPRGGGTVVMRWRIEPDGQTSEVERHGGDLDNPPLYDCLAKLVGSLRFASHPGSRLPPIDFPMSF